MLDKLGTVGVAGLVVVAAGIGLVAWQAPIVAAGLALVLSGVGLVAYGMLTSLLSAFGMGGMP
ncbi:DUF7470 family protein [Haloarcula litorea]|uniref:DUF7470 family protein n=1 Tax=Haloarcula litorea TaxID=3032579 RepID=UPI0023E7B5BE|nr:hypothetical protein [Halomicroarcula sp. GDY20]